MSSIKAELNSFANKKKAKIYQGFFKTGIGEYGEGDVFIGITVPQTRSVAKKFSGAALTDLKPLLHSKIHEERLVALLILVEKFNGAKKKDKKKFFDFYLSNRIGVNNWDLVDLSADKIVGEYLFDKEKTLLYKYACSKKLWEKRIAIISTFAFIKKNKFKGCLKVSEMLLEDEHDLIHKAVG